MLVPPLVDTCAGAEFYRRVWDQLCVRFSLVRGSGTPLASAKRPEGQRRVELGSSTGSRTEMPAPAAGAHRLERRPEQDTAVAGTFRGNPPTRSARGWRRAASVTCGAGRCRAA